MTATGVAGEGRSGGERWTIERHGWRYLRGRQFRFSLRRFGASGNSPAEALDHDRGMARTILRPDPRSAAKTRRRGGGGPPPRPGAKPGGGGGDDRRQIPIAPLIRC